MTKIQSVTRGPADLIRPRDGDNFRYGLGFPFQIGPRQAALLCNLRVEGMPVGDFENGVDALLFEDLENVAAGKSIPIARNDKYVDAKTAEPRIAIKYPIVGGFVPHQALREDGMAHPHAGTGFGLSQTYDFPMLGDGYYDKRHKSTKMVRKVVLHQFAFNGSDFSVLDEQVFSADDPLRAPGSDWRITSNGLRTAIPDGDDLLCPVCATTSDSPRCYPNPMSVGVSRWQYASDRWELSSYVPVVISRKPANPRIRYDEPVWLGPGEPSVVRDIDGSLLFSARSTGDDIEDHIVRVWRSKDRGESWSLIIEIPEARGQGPVTINEAADGTPYLAANALGHERDWLRLWPLNSDRSGLEEPITIRNATEEFGPPPVGPVWFMDHPTALTLRLADGRWHHVLIYRIMDRGEHSGKDPAPQTGLYLEEVFSNGETRAPWRFAD